MTIYRKSDRPDMDSDGNTADAAAEAGSTDGAADIQSTQSIPPIEDPVLITDEDARSHSSHPEGPEASHSYTMPDTLEDPVLHTPEQQAGRPAGDATGSTTGIIPGAGAADSAEDRPLEETQTFNPLLDDDSGPDGWQGVGFHTLRAEDMPAGGSTGTTADAGAPAGSTETAGSTDAGAASTGDAATAIVTAPAASSAGDPANRPNVLPAPDFDTSTLIFPPAGTPAAAGTAQNGPADTAVLGSAASPAAEPPASSAAATVPAIPPAAAAATQAIAPSPSARQEADPSAQGIFSSATQVFAESEPDQLDPDLDQLVSNFGEDTASSGTPFAGVGTRGTEASEELGAGGLSAAARKEDENQRKLIRVTVITLIAIVAVIALVYGGLAIRRAMRTSEYNTALSSCQAATAKMQTASGELSEQLSKAESVTSSVSGSDVEDSATITQLRTTVSNARDTSNSINAVEACSPSLVRGKLEEIVQKSTTLTANANKLAQSLKNDVSAVQKSQAAKAKSNARESLESAVSRAQALYTSSNGRVMDDQVRSDLESAIDSARTLLNKSGSSVTADEYSDEQKTLESAMANVTSSVNAKAQADREQAEQQRREQDGNQGGNDNDSDTGGDSDNGQDSNE
ncbi:MAG: hypothetical protein HXO72_01090 [Scardovia wiggsiae]|uniref:hypothetical protein n=1 Tax=Scardovia wiggsiae TaxID=230143 RepID=UPI001CB05CF1|nr:hypothetical protein [Scardovia wiggsiae]